MRVPFEPGRRDPRADLLLGEFTSQHFDDRFYAACELVDRYSLDWALDIAGSLGLADHLSRPRTAEELGIDLGISDSCTPALRWLLERLRARGQVEAVDGCFERFRFSPPVQAGELEPLRRIAAELGCGLERTLRLFDAAGEIWARVLRSDLKAEDLLLGPSRVQLWVDYFHNENRTYSISNALTAVAASNRLSEQGRWSVLEVGAGTGSATLSLLQELERRGCLDTVAEYWVTEPAAFFRRRAERELRARFPHLPFRFQYLDLDRDFDEQGVPGPFDLVMGVNVFHVARDLKESLRRALRALKPGGWLVAGECFRLFPGQAVPAELVFQLLESFRQVELDPDLRPNPGFLEPEMWLGLVKGAGFESVALLPDLQRMREIYPRFFSGVVVGRRPAAN